MNSEAPYRQGKELLRTYFPEREQEVEDEVLMHWMEFLKKNPEPVPEKLRWWDFLRTELPPEKMEWIEFLRTESPPKEAEKPKVWLDVLHVPQKHSKKVLLKSDSRKSLLQEETWESPWEEEEGEEVEWTQFLRTQLPPHYNKDTEEVDWTQFLRTEAPPRPKSAPPQVREKGKDALHWEETLGRWTDRKGGEESFRENPFKLPDELTLRILAFLDLPSLAAVAGTCRYLYSLSNDNGLWKFFYSLHSPVEFEGSSPQRNSTEENWKTKFQSSLPATGDWQGWRLKESGSRGKVPQWWKDSIKFFTPKRIAPRVFLFGLSGAGKTTILHTLLRLAHSSVPPTLPSPSLGCTYAVVPFPHAQFHMLDVAGVHCSSKYRPFHRAFEYVDCNILVIDAADIRRMPRVRQLVDFLLKHKTLAHRPLLVWANKKDISQNMYVDVICDILSRHKNPFSDWYLQSSCGITGEGLHDGLEWLTDVLTGVLQPS